MNCRETRDRLLVGRPASGAAGVDDHVATCAGCVEFARRLTVTQDALAAHHAGARPDPAFAERVVAQLSTGRVELLGWAALRVLPATVAVLLVLAWITVRIDSGPADPALPAPTENVLSWVVDQAEAP